MFLLPSPLIFWILVRHRRLSLSLQGLISCLISRRFLSASADFDDGVGSDLRADRSVRVRIVVLRNARSWISAGAPSQLVASSAAIHPGAGRDTPCKQSARSRSNQIAHIPGCT